MRTVILTLSLAACAAPADQYRAVLPDDRLLIDEGAFDDAALARGVGEPSDYYTITRDVTRDTNAAVGAVLLLVETIASYPPTWSDAESLVRWGPWYDSTTATFAQMWVQQEADGAYGWAIEARAEDAAEDAWTGLLAGHVDAGATEEASSGWFALDLTAVASLDPLQTATGELGCEYIIDQDYASATVGFGAISEDGAIPADGAYHYEQTRGAGGLMDLVIEGDASEPPNGSAETLIIRSRWQLDGQGRADAYVTGGDVGDLVYTESDCWDASHTTVYFQNNFALVTEGDPSRCAFAEAEFSDAR
jgi:hypothetical protein